VSYSYGNLFDGGFNTLLSFDQIRGATEAALALWASVVPINFSEVLDSGPRASDIQYPAAGVPDIRLGYHPDAVDLKAHAFFPMSGGGLAGDAHFNNTALWSYGIFPFQVDFVGAVLHELGHSVGVQHIFGVPAIMSGEIFTSFGDPKRIFLYPADVAAVRQIYGAGTGSVRPLNGTEPVPEPATIVLVTAAIAILAARGRRRQFNAHARPDRAGNPGDPPTPLSRFS
jgi:hypothetical protein